MIKEESNIENSTTSSLAGLPEKNQNDPPILSTPQGKKRLHSVSPKYMQKAIYRMSKSLYSMKSPKKQRGIRSMLTQSESRKTTLSIPNDLENTVPKTIVENTLLQTINQTSESTSVHLPDDDSDTMENVFLNSTADSISLCLPNVQKALQLSIKELLQDNIKEFVKPLKEEIEDLKGQL
ncbi:hypothetical protein SNE40_002890 [Patella caerulea]|uniref:Uncharacterized protein n=1 Tax=Patella caerulea TaxID=87958 RepID=A0AAN8Q489_PATCE